MNRNDLKHLLLFFFFEDYDHNFDGINIVKYGLNNMNTSMSHMDKYNDMNCQTVYNL